MAYQSVPMGLGIMILLSLLCFVLLASILVPALWKLYTLLPLFSRSGRRARRGQPESAPIPVESRWDSRHDR